MFPFDRLIRSVDELLGTGTVRDRITAQIGSGRYEPRHMAFDRFLTKPEYETRIQQADILISHAGVGSIAIALRYGKALLVVPRLERNGEHVNDHQIATARKFEELGHVLVAYDTAEIPARLELLRSFAPREREARRTELAARIGQFLSETFRPTEMSD